MHQQSARIVPGAKVAVMFLHGICGSVNQFRNVIPLEQFVPDDCSYYSLLYPGHGGSVLDFANSSMKEWTEYVWYIFRTLSETHDKILLVGHSMGTLFSIHLALEFPEKVAALLLVEVPLRVGIKGYGAKNLYRWSRNKLDLTDPLQAATAQVVGIEPSDRMLHYLRWIPRLLELVALMHQTSTMVKQLQQEVIAYQSPRDELVSVRSAKILERSGRVDVRYFTRSTHFHFDAEESRQIQAIFLQMLTDQKQ